MFNKGTFLNSSPELSRRRANCSVHGGSLVFVYL